MRQFRRAVVAAGVAAALIVPSVPAHADGVRYKDVLFDDVVKTSDVEYGEAVNSQGQLQQLFLDVYQPDGDEATGRGLYIWAHGGNFIRGNKNSTGPLLDYVRRGWVGISINYRLHHNLVGGAIIGILQNPDQIAVAQRAAKDAQHDMQAAVRWARANAGDLRIDPAKIAVGGISAGGIMAEATAFGESDPGNSGTPGVSSRVAAAIVHAGAYAPILQGGFPQPGAPPIGVYHGTNDEQVPYPTGPIGCVLTIAVGNTCEFVTFVTDTHRTLGTDLALDFLYRHVILDRSVDRFPLLTDLESNPIRILAGAEPANTNLGLSLGVVSPTDPETIQAGFIQLIEYALDTIQLPIPIG